MHPNPIFHDRDREANLAFARARGFGMLAINGAEGPLLAHVPFTIAEGGAALHLHLARSNAIVRALAAPGGPVSAVLAVAGPDGYVSPDWYGLPDQVPTWNYVAVHLRGTLELLPQERLPELLAELSAEFEARLAPKREWVMDKMSPGAAERLMRAIVPLRLSVATVDGTWKLGQNKGEATRLAAAAALPEGIGQELATLSALMR